MDKQDAPAQGRIRPARPGVVQGSMTTHIIERAFQLAPTCSNIEDIRIALRREGYSSIEAHLAGRSIRADLAKLLHRPE